MSRSPIRIRTFILGTFLVLLVLPTVAAAAAWMVQRDRQRAGVDKHVNAAFAYVSAHRGELQDPAAIQGFAGLLDRLGLLGQLTLVTTDPPAKGQIYSSPALNPVAEKEQLARGKAGNGGTTTVPIQKSAGFASQSERSFPTTISGAPATVVADLYYPPSSRATRALAAVVTGVIVLLGGLAVAVWLAGRWMVSPLTRLSTEVDKVAGGDLTIAVPRSRIGEIANIAQAVEGMTVALGETAQRQADADEARRFLVTSIAHDLRTPLFALRGHLQAIGWRLGDPAEHLERAETRADALERLIGNLFAYTRDDFAQPTLRLEAVPVAELLGEVTAGLEHAARLHDNTFELDGDPAIAVTVDRDRFKRALTNILDNALRYSPPDAPIHLGWAAADESSVELTVRDHGPGIETGLLPHIFEPGIRGTPPDAGLDEGAGLGLAIAKRLLEHQDAALTVENEGTAGARISLVLQRSARQSEEHP